MKTSIKLGTKVGILGGGQLARMMAFRAQEMGMQVHILCPSKDEPAAQVTQYWHKGDPNVAKELAEFLQHIDCLSFESEFFDAKYIEQILRDNLSKQKLHSFRLAPSAQILGKLQDRLSQKELLDQYKIPSAKFLSVQSAKDLELANSIFSKSFVLKLRTNGYDGKGTWVFDKAKVSHQNLPNFQLQPCIAEEKIQIKKELAVIFVRSSHGEVVQLPLVQSLQKDNRCDVVLGPMKHKDLAQVSKKIVKMLNAENYVGAIGFEFFDCPQGLIVNEVAPRVHNTGHYSQLALSEDQFSLHMKAVCGLHISSPTALSKYFAMVNLIGLGNKELEVPANLKGSLHWYGKIDSKLGRKMGHINYIGNSLSQLKALALRERKKFKI